MKKTMAVIRSVVGVAFCVLLWACTSEQDKLNQAASEAASLQFQSELKEEISKAVSGKTNLQATAVDIVTKRSEFEILKSEIRGTSAEVEVRVLTIPTKVRTSLIEIIAKLDSQKERNFNVPDAIGLISLQMGVPPEERATLNYKFKFRNEGGWKNQAAPKSH